MRPVHWILLGIAGILGYSIVTATVKISQLPIAPMTPPPYGISTEAGFRQGILAAVAGKPKTLEVLVPIFRQLATTSAAFRPYYDAWASHALRAAGFSPTVINLARQAGGVTAPIPVPSGSAIPFNGYR